jgi:hypothetical protein
MTNAILIFLAALAGVAAAATPVSASAAAAVAARTRVERFIESLLVSDYCEICENVLTNLDTILTAASLYIQLLEVTVLSRNITPT